MSGFYGQLAKEALGDDVSDVSDGELDDMLANMDDLDADLFGTKNIPKITSATKPDPFISDTIPMVAVKSEPSVKFTPTIAKSKKSELLSELFGADDEEEINKNAKEPSLSAQFQSKSPQMNFKLETPSMPIEIKSPVNFETDYNASLSGSYMPLTGERRKRNIQRNKPVEDLWGEFMQPAAHDTNLSKSAERTQLTDISQPHSSENLPTAIETRINKEATPKLKSGENDKEQISSIPAPSWAPTSVKFELTEDIEEKILTLLKDEQQKTRNELMEKFEDNLRELKEENSTLKGEITILMDKVSSQELQTQDLIEKIEEKDKATDDLLKSCTADLEKTINDFQLQIKEQFSDTQCQISQMEELLRDLQHTADNVHPLIASLKEKLSDLQNKQEQDLQIMGDHLEHLRETHLDDNKKLKRATEEKLFKISSEMGEFDIMDGKLRVLEGNVKKLFTAISNSRFEDEVVRKLENSESGMLQKLNFCSNQQVRQESWHQQQLNDISEHMNQRLWSLHRQVELNVSSVKSEIDTLRVNMTNRLGEMEGKVACAESETCRLSRLAERLCGLLQLWEMRNKESSRIQEVAEQSLRERFALAMEERRIDQN